MAYQQVCPPHVNFTNSVKATNPYGNDGVQSGAQVTAPVDYTSVQSLRNALNAVNGAYYTFARLDTMCVNDMIFAVRNTKDAITIASFMTNQAA
jgi:hypothetical protein